MGGRVWSGLNWLRMGTSGECGDGQNFVTSWGTGRFWGGIHLVGFLRYWRVTNGVCGVTWVCPVALTEGRWIHVTWSAHVDVMRSDTAYRCNVTKWRTVTGCQLTWEEDCLCVSQTGVISGAAFVRSTPSGEQFSVCSVHFRSIFTFKLFMFICCVHTSTAPTAISSQSLPYVLSLMSDCSPCYQYIYIVLCYV